MRCLHEDFVEGATFHIYNHAIDDYNLFYDDEDYDYFLNIFENNLKKVPASVYAYCLMPNHYHFLIRQDSDVQVYRLFNYAFVKYALYFNKKYDRKGPIFRSALQHKLVDNNTYLLQLSKYIFMNPVRANLVNHPNKWPFTNLAQIDENSPISNMLENHGLSIEGYKKFVFSIYSSFEYSKKINFI